MANDLYSTYVFGNTAFVQGQGPLTVTGTTTTATNTWYPQGTVQWTQTQGTQPQGTASLQNPTIYYDWQTLQQLQRQYAEQQRAYDQQIAQWRELYMFGRSAFKTNWDEPEKLETKELNAVDRERLREALPF